jgi:Phosphoserine phosphatase RsbU, N-terminal domain
MSDELERLRRDLRPSLLAWLSRGDEAGRRNAYELGREAMRNSIGILDLVRLHTDAVLAVLGSVRSVEEACEVSEAAAEYLVELVSPFEMARRGFMDLGPGSGVPSEPSVAEGDG